jgi:hypothetical protein
MREIRNAYNISVSKPKKKKDNLGNLGIEK